MSAGRRALRLAAILATVGIAPSGAAAEAPVPVAKPGAPAAPAGERRAPANRAAPPAQRITPPAADTKACLARLKATGAVFVAVPPIREGECGADAPLRLSEAGGLRLDPPAVTGCDAALAFAQWAAQVVRPAATLHLRTEATSLAIAASYACRTRRTGRPGGSRRLSEHAKANAIDVSAVRLENGRTVPVKPRPGSASPERAFQAAIRGGACALFTTVIGPTTDPAHSNHLHLDRARRRGGYRLCQ